MATLLGMSMGSEAMRTLIAALLLSTSLPATAADTQIRGNAIYLTGILHAGDEYVFEAKTASLPKGATLILKSVGGSASSTFRIGNAVRDRRFATFVPDYRLSGCSLIFLAGSPRSMTKRAKIGFHRSRDKTDNSRTPLVDWIAAGYLQSMGYGPAVQEFALGATPENMVFLTQADIERLGLQVTILTSRQGASQALAHGP
jgi:hypothetical protein